MTTTMKLKSILCSIFQTQNPLMLSKSMRHVDSMNSDENSSEYQLRREKNNESVRKSRAKNRQRIQECAERVKELKTENKQLNSQLDSLQSELYTLKDLFQNSFSMNNLSIKPSEIPTSTLYKLIMRKDMNQDDELQLSSKTPSPSSSPYSSPVSPASSSLSTNTEPVVFNQTDRFYINQLKNAITNLYTFDSTNAVSIENNNSNVFRKSISQDHDYSVSN